MRAEFLNLDDVFSRLWRVSEGTHSRGVLRDEIAFLLQGLAEENFSITPFFGTFLSQGTRL